LARKYKYSNIFSNLVILHTYPPLKVETECSETSAHKIQTPGNYSEESIQHSEKGESLKSRNSGFFETRRISCVASRLLASQDEFCYGCQLVSCNSKLRAT